MSRIVETLDAGDVVQVAAMVEQNHKCRDCTDDACEHDSRRRCPSCTGDGCEQLTWAKGILAEARRDRAAFRRAVATW